MNLSKKLTLEEERLREEFVTLEERIRMKIRRICATNLKLPYERLSAGRHLKELCLLAIASIDNGDEITLAACMWELREKGINI